MKSNENERWYLMKERWNVMKVDDENDNEMLRKWTRNVMKINDAI